MEPNIRHTHGVKMPLAAGVALKITGGLLPPFPIKMITTKDFYHPDYEVGCGGSEIVMKWTDGKRYLYVWNKVKGCHEYYVFNDDLFIKDTEAPWLPANMLKKEITLPVRY